MEGTADDASAERLVAQLRALASPARIRILRALVTPTRAPSLRVPADRERAGLEPERLLGRSTVIEHLDVLAAAGLVRRVGEEYVVDRQGMVAFLQDLGDLARLRPLVEVDVESTRTSRAGATPSGVPLPRLVIVGGPEAGRAFSLAGAGPWMVGRAPSCEVALGHDPHVSRAHARLSKEREGFVANVSSSAKNAASIDFETVLPGASAPIRPGSILVVGATTLVLQA